MDKLALSETEDDSVFERDSETEEDELTDSDVETLSLAV